MFKEYGPEDYKFQDKDGNVYFSTPAFDYRGMFILLLVWCLVPSVASLLLIFSYV